MSPIRGRRVMNSRLVPQKTRRAEGPKHVQSVEAQMSSHWCDVEKSGTKVLDSKYFSYQCPDVTSCSSALSARKQKVLKKEKKTHCRTFLGLRIRSGKAHPPDPGSRDPEKSAIVESNPVVIDPVGSVSVLPRLSRPTSSRIHDPALIRRTVVSTPLVDTSFYFPRRVYPKKSCLLLTVVRRKHGVTMAGFQQL
ncbi:hypothetical protein TNCV_3314491 [Trichonephila clavipes]|nr:hypothetical protein TNCV_3314491 [Trichonephila clavipes]